MSRRYLFGPVNREFSEQFLYGARRDGLCRTFSETGESDIQLSDNSQWSQLKAQLGDFEPQAICLWLGYCHIPDWIWSVPVPIIGLAPDWNLLWHYYQLALPFCDLVVTDGPGCRRLNDGGFEQTLSANLFGLGRQWLDEPAAALVRDIDICLIGNLNPDVQADRARWLMSLARHADRRHVVIRTGVFGADYQQLMRRSRIVFNRSIRGECNARVLETLAAGALLFSEADNEEVNRFLKPGEHYVPYSRANFDRLLNYYCDHENERQRIAEQGRQLARKLTFDRLWSDAWGQVESQWPQLVERSTRRKQPDEKTKSLMAAYQSLSEPGRHLEGTIGRIAQCLVDHSDSRILHQAMGVLQEHDLVASQASLKRAQQCKNRSYSIGTDLANSALAAGQREEALTIAKESLKDLFHSEANAAEDFVAPNFSRFHVVWERCGWDHPGDAVGQQWAYGCWARWRLHSQLADMTAELGHFHEAALAMPDQPSTRAALGCALARAGRPFEALPHLQEAFSGNPLDRAAARALFQLLGDTGDTVGQRRMARDLRLLAIAAPQVAPSEPWFMQCPPPGDELASIIIPCCNNLGDTKACVTSIMRYSRGPFELILVDNGSSDGTAEYFKSLNAQDGCLRVDVITNPHNRGFPVACNQGLMRSAGDFVVFLNNDTVVTPDWLTSMIRWSLQDWPRVGLVGAVTNYAPEPQMVVPNYGKDLAGLDRFSARRKEQFAGRALEVQRISGFCLLARRDVLKRVGGFDERFGIGFFDDDDLGLRVREAGLKLIVALDTYIHHHGSRTFQSLGVDAQRLLAENFEKFRIKWGAERTAGYRSPNVQLEPPPQTVPDAPAVTIRQAPSTNRPRVTLSMIVKNEEGNLADCLHSVEGLFDEIVVVDTGSTDRTREIAVGLGAKVFEFPWIDDFAAARNASIGHANGEFIFWMDADDRLDPNDREKLRELLNGLGDQNMAYVIKCVCTPRTTGESATVVDHVRLFRNLPQHRWKYRVHEQILPALRSTGCDVKWADIHVHHVGYHDPALRGRKLERDLKILQAEYDSNPDDPFTLFNLGSVYQELDRCDEALPMLRKSLEHSHPADSIVRKLFALIVGCHRRLGQVAEAAAVIAEGRKLYPQDVELLFFEGVMHREQGNAAAAEASWLKLLSDPEGSHFASVDAGLRGPKARHNLAILYFEANRIAEAEAQWRAALSADPTFIGGWMGLGELYLKKRRWSDVETVIGNLGGENGIGKEGSLLRGRMYLAKKEYASAKWILSELISTYPDAVEPRIILTHVLLQEGKDKSAAESALNDVLRLDPDNREAKHNLEVLRIQKQNAVTY